ncbi:hypothetical protein F5Y13DRAFT_29339 [Hypoxylon sp. FL1857]|nr:hypothetical protein F5Y13DRAFT_29339 [Hypoxylon sp. FL1857]
MDRENHNFASEVWVDDRVHKPIPVDDIWMPFQSWRLTFLIFNMWYFYFLLLVLPIIELGYITAVYIIASLFVLRLIQLIASLFSRKESDPIKSLTGWMRICLTRCKLMILISVSFVYKRMGHKPWVWRMFWIMYFYLTLNRPRMLRNFIEARRQNPEFKDYFIVIFVDNKTPVKIPLPDPGTANTLPSQNNNSGPNQDAIDDAHLLMLLNTFSRYAKVQCGIIQALLPKDTVRVDTVELLEGSAPGRPCSTLNLGYHQHQQMGHFTTPERFNGKKDLINQLVQDGVYRPAESNTTPMALNFVSGWNVQVASVIILTPTVISIAVAIIWPMVAVLHFGVIDVQQSVETGASLASYIVTAGGFLIALATWYDTIATIKGPEQIHGQLRNQSHGQLQNEFSDRTQ